MGGPVHVSALKAYNSLDSCSHVFLQSIFTELEHCDETITLACLRALYDFVYVPVATKKNSIGVGEHSFPSPA